MASPIIDPSKVSVLVAGGMGAFLSVLFQRSANKLTILSTIVSAETVDYYFAQPVWTVLHDNFGWADAQWQGPVALSLGLLAIFIVGAITRLAAQFAAEPMKTLSAFAVSILERVLPGKKER